VAVVSGRGLSVDNVWPAPIDGGVAQSRQREQQSRPHTAGEASNDWTGGSVLRLVRFVGRRCSRDAAHRRPWPIGGKGAAGDGRTGSGVVDAARKGGPAQARARRRASAVGRKRSSRHGRESRRRTTAAGAGERTAGIWERGSTDGWAAARVREAGGGVATGWATRQAGWVGLTGKRVAGRDRPDRK
jgi:hypothetical protein